MKKNSPRFAQPGEIDISGMMKKEVMVVTSECFLFI